MNNKQKTMQNTAKQTKHKKIEPRQLSKWSQQQSLCSLVNWYAWVQNPTNILTYMYVVTVRYVNVLY